MIAVLGDALKMLAARPWSSLSRGLGVSLGACAFVLAFGLGQTMSQQVDERFSITQATTITIEATGDAVAAVVDPREFVSDPSLERVRSIGGVESACRLAMVQQRQVGYSVSSAVPPATAETIDVTVAGSCLKDTAETATTGLTLAAIDDTFGRRVALLGAGAARTLGIEHPGGFVTLGGEELYVIGIIDDTERAPQILSSIIIGEALAGDVLQGVRMRPTALVRTRPGAADVVSSNLALTAHPTEPTAVRVNTPPSPAQLRRSVGGDVQALALGAALVVLFAGVFAISNLMLLSVTSRIPEIGMRRAMGATPTDIIGMVVAECTVIGALAGVVGSLVGMTGLLAICIWQGWTPVLSIWAIAAGIAAGILGGIGGGLAPASVAARITPARAIRA